ncbi:unnamed protein product [Boreogadus saida]
MAAAEAAGESEENFVVVTLYAGELNDGNQSTGWSPGDEVPVRCFTEREGELFAYCGCGPAVVLFDFIYMSALEAHTSSLEVLHVSSPIPSGIGELFHALSQSSGSGEVVILGPVWCPLGHLGSTQPTKRGSVSLAGVHHHPTPECHQPGSGKALRGEEVSAGLSSEILKAGDVLAAGDGGSAWPESVQHHLFKVLENIQSASHSPFSTRGEEEQNLQQRRAQSQLAEAQEVIRDLDPDCYFSERGAFVCRRLPLAVLTPWRGPEELVDDVVMRLGCHRRPTDDRHYVRSGWSRPAAP